MAKAKKKSKTAAKAPTKAAAPPKKRKKSEQLKIPGTGRTDAIPEIEAASEAYRDKRNERMEAGEEEMELQAALTDVLEKHGKTEYVYEGADGKPYRAFVPKKALAKVQRVKMPAPEKPAKKDDGDGDEDED